MELTAKHLSILQKAAVLGSWHVDASTLAPAGELAAHGYVEAADGDEGIVNILPTDKGRNALVARGLIFLGTRGPYDRTPYHAVGGWLDA